ncbi:hypothetical protein [Methylobacterium sp. J-092]|uniref:hypothetical protein n=1 Tax=Methylobacterium sp. J-092 TaxID=2836667 RepID=UPI001FB91BD5|nr:hypothetical protein [Methylobacterium sp. J-092]MCJ2008207.1 hypothetical protein [Methylobacterium sp. J-092]
MGKRINISWVAYIAIFFCSPAFSQGLGQVIAKQGYWELRKSKDGFSDKTTCVMVLSRDPTVQITAGQFYMNYRSRGGVQGFEYRIDEDASSGMKLPSMTEKELGLIGIKDDLGNVLLGHRLRLKILTYRGLANEDINLTGLGDLYDKMLSKCPN